LKLGKSGLSQKYLKGNLFYSAGLQIGRTAKRDMVHRLRKQLKSRDEMILRMQVQISEYERSLSLSEVHVSELQAHLEATSGVLSDLDKEVQLFRNQLADFVKFDAKIQDRNESAAGGAESATTCGDERRVSIAVQNHESVARPCLVNAKKFDLVFAFKDIRSMMQESNRSVERVGMSQNRHEPFVVCSFLCRM